MLVSFGQLFAIILIVYVAMWALCKLIAFILVKHDYKTAFTSARKWTIAGTFIKYFGALNALITLGLLRWFFPAVLVVSQDPDLLQNNEYEDFRFSFGMKKYYAPLLIYNGVKLEPFETYVFNTTDSVLVIYPTIYEENLHVGLGDLNELVYVNPHSCVPFSNKIEYEFVVPEEFEIGRYRSYREKVWTIDSRYGALLARDRISKNIEINKLNSNYFNPFKNSFSTDYLSNEAVQSILKGALDDILLDSAVYGTYHLYMVEDETKNGYVISEPNISSFPSDDYGSGVSFKIDSLREFPYKGRILEISDTTAPYKYMIEIEAKDSENTEKAETTEKPDIETTTQPDQTREEIYEN